MTADLPSGLLHELRARFDLSADQADPRAIDDAIRSGVPFRGTNLWLLIFAIVVASVGLNVNSTAVIIGAMLISPLMGPIIGAGYGAGVADFALVRTALWNLVIATAVSLVSSALYFSLTPLSGAHSELLARTSPTIWDVLIALFGGLAGIVGITRREKSNVVPGVAIATALMPPLCTAGYGLATGSPTWFAGAFYLFFINSVFIAAATFGMVRILRLPEVSYVDAASAQRARHWVAVLVVGTALPSLVLAQRLVADEVFGARVAAFLAGAFPPDGETFVISHDVDARERRVRVTVVGESVSAERQAVLSSMLPGFGLEGATLAIAQTQQQDVDVAALRQELARDLYQHTLVELDDRQHELEALRQELASVKETTAQLGEIEREIAAQYPELERIVVTSGAAGSSLAVVIETSRPLGAETDERLRAWLRVRAGVDDVWVLETRPTRGDEPRGASRGGSAPGGR